MKERLSFFIRRSSFFFSFFPFDLEILYRIFVVLLNCVPFDGAFLELTGRLRAKQKSAFFFTETFHHRIKLQHEIERKLSRKIDFPSIIPFFYLFSDNFNFIVPRSLSNCKYEFFSGKKNKRK